MKTLYLECNMGAAGDMLMGALLELHPRPEGFLERLNGLGLPGVQVSAEKKTVCGIVGTHMRVTVHGAEEGHSHGHEHGHEHNHAAPGDIAHLIGHLELPEAVRKDALAVYDAIAQAEGKAHGMPVTEIHFHEVGTMDAVADVVGVCLLLHELGAEDIVASPVHVGCGQVRCAHGILPVPAPATAALLEGIPIYGGEVEGELCTPTGAALLRHFVRDFGPMPVMAVERTGCGVGTRELPRANMVRAMLGTRAAQTPEGMEEIAELSCSIDDMTAEDLSFAAEVLRQAGALEVYTTAANMKKGRGGAVLCCICRRTDRETMVTLMFRHLSTLGVRENLSRRYVMTRGIETRQTALGPVRVKYSRGWGAEKEKPEFEDLKAIAEKTGMSMAQIRERLRAETE